MDVDSWMGREKREKSYKCFLDDLKRCEMLGLLLYNFQCVYIHLLVSCSSSLGSSPGSTVGQATKEESISYVAQCINRAHKETESVVIVIENMVRQDFRLIYMYAVSLNNR